ncbi:MAG: OmpH family outer membrane protein [Saprospiraceae bacterium]|nr:OmpH family outer membrane protein [Saprospiraceae bacterium]
MKNLSLILNVVLLAAIAHLYYLNSKKSGTENVAITPPASMNAGAKIAWVNADTLDAQYEWLKTQKVAIEQRMKNAGNSIVAKRDALAKDMMAFEQKAQAGNSAPADLQKEYDALQARQQRLGEEAEKLDHQISEDQKKAFNDLYANVEAQLKTLSSQIGYDYIFSYSRGGQILMASDSLDITKQVLELLNAKKD